MRIPTMIVDSTMNDSYPSHLTIEIDRIPLARYQRMSRFMLCLLPLSFFGGLLGFVAGVGSIERGDLTGINAVLSVIKGLAMGLGISSAVALVIYLVFCHWTATRYANSLEVTVEGAFLRIRQHSGARTDRKLHFRSIVDYTTYQDTLMRRFGIHSLHMATIGGGPHSIVVIPGVKDCERVRDMLSEIDRLRENNREG